jgi:glyoxylase-like metal-dependent hydrolase (beta-lactamase superfamily II)
MTYRVQVFKAGQADVPGPEVFWMSHWDTWETLFFYIVLIRGNGITAIVNTGPPGDLGPLNEAWRSFAGERCRYIRHDEERTPSILARAGIAPEEVDYVLLTPLQAYATANVPLFPRARICCSRRGWIEEIVAREAHFHVPRHFCVPDDVLRYMLFDAADRLTLLADEDEIAPGLSAWWAGTHHRSSMVYSVETENGRVLIGDCAFKYGNLEGAPLGIAESLEEARTAYARIRRQADHLIPLYDPAVFERYPRGIVA